MTYYVLSGDTATSASGMTATGQDILTSTDPDIVQRGLVRRQLDRAVSQYALANGLISGTDEVGEVVAAEVASIEFQYFDGIEWRYEWDTEVEGALPVAIEVVLLMMPFGASTALDGPLGAESPLEDTQLRYHRMVVQLPTGQPVEDTTTSGATSTEETGMAP